MQRVDHRCRPCMAFAGMDLHAQGGPALHQLQPGQPASDLGWSTRVDKCGSPDGGGSLDTSATALAPRPVAPNAPPLATLTDSASAGTGSPGDTPTSLQHQLQGRQPSGRVRQQHKGAALPKASTPAGDASARRSKRKGDKEVPRPAPRRPPNASEGNCKQRLGSACAPALAPLMQHGQPSGATPPGLHWFDGGVGTCSAAVQHGPVLELPGLEDLDDGENKGVGGGGGGARGRREGSPQMATVGGSWALFYYIPRPARPPLPLAAAVALRCQRIPPPACLPSQFPGWMTCCRVWPRKIRSWATPSRPPPPPSPPPGKPPTRLPRQRPPRPPRRTSSALPLITRGLFRPRRSTPPACGRRRLRRCWSRSR
jgi:hypothetical protein